MEAGEGRPLRRGLLLWVSSVVVAFVEGGCWWAGGPGRLNPLVGRYESDHTATCPHWIDGHRRVGEVVKLARLDGGA